MTLFGIPSTAEDRQDVEFHLAPYSGISGFMRGIGAIVVIVEFLPPSDGGSFENHVLDSSLSPGLRRLADGSWCRPFHWLLFIRP